MSPSSNFILLHSAVKLLDLHEHRNDREYYIRDVALLPNFEYDIFISYRHNDNRSGWVTEFVNALQEQVDSTIKEPLSILTRPLMIACT